MRTKLIVCLVVLIASWTQANAQPSNKSQSSGQVPARSTILRAFRSDISACMSITKVLKTDRAFIDSFISYENRTAKPFEKFLLQSPNSGSTEFQYVIRNGKYIDIDVSFHGDALAVAWVENEGIYCAPTLARLEEIEALGESEDAWTVRQFFLDKVLQGLEHPSDEMVDGKVDFESFKSFVLKADERYRHTQRPRFLAWTRAAIKVIVAGRKDIQDGAAGLSASEQNKILDERILFLRSFAKR